MCLDVNDKNKTALKELNFVGIKFHVFYYGP